MGNTFPQFGQLDVKSGLPGLALVEGDEYVVYDQEGNDYIDLKANSSNVTLGYTQPKLVEAVSDQLGTLPYTDSSHPLRDQLAGDLLNIADMDGGRVGFTTGGSLAIEKGLKLVRDLNDNPSILSFSEGYHGSTYETSKLSEYESMAEPYTPGDPYEYNIKIDAPTADTDYGEFLDQFEETIRTNDIGAFIAEPYISSHLTFLPTEVWNEMAAICREQSVYIILDEIITGMGRTGRYLASGRFDFTPDIIVVGKGLTSGYQPLAATIISERIASEYRDRTFMGGYTNHGDPPACAAGLAVLELLERRDVLSKVRDRGKQVLDRLESLADLDVVSRVRGEGLLCGATLAEDIDRLDHRALDQGVIVKVVGSKVVLTPPLVIDEKGIDQGLKRLEAAMRSA